jgi:hypothetical protein
MGLKRLDVMPETALFYQTCTIALRTISHRQYCVYVYKHLIKADNAQYSASSELHVSENAWKNGPFMWFIHLNGPFSFQQLTLRL